MSKGKAFIRVHYSSTSLLSCTARIVNSCPSYTKQSAFKTKQYFLFFKSSWSHLPSCPGTSSFTIPEHSQAHGTAMTLSPSTEPPSKFPPGKGLWSCHTGASVFWKTTSIAPACSPRKASEGINELSRSNVLKSTQLFIFLREASQGPCWNLNHKAQPLCGHEGCQGSFPKSRC